MLDSIKVVSRKSIQKQRYSSMVTLSAEDRFEDLSSYSMEMRDRKKMKDHSYFNYK